MIGFVFFNAAGKALNKPNSRDFESAIVEDKNYDILDLDWTANSRRFRAPDGAVRMRVFFFCEDNPGGARHAREDIEPALEIASITIERQGEPVRQRRERFLAVLIPAEVDSKKRRIQKRSLIDGSVTTIDGEQFSDTVISTDSSTYIGNATRVQARLAVLRRKKSSEKLIRFFASRTTILQLPEFKLDASRPVSLSFATDENAGLLRVHSLTQLSLSVQSAHFRGTLEPGAYRLEFREDSLTVERTYTEEDQVLMAHPLGLDALREGLKPWFERLEADRDKYADKENLALKATVRASGSLEERFGPEHIIDNDVRDAFGDGSFRYDQPDIVTARLAGYGKGWAQLYGFDYPYRIKPTYWLAEHESANAWVELDLGEEHPIELVRLLNTTNGGFNDRATIDFRVTLLDKEERVVASQDEHFGKPLPRPVENPQPTYGKSFRFWYEPQTPVPFGDGFVDVNFAEAKKARYVRVTILLYWGFGGGLNEVQAYAK